MKQDIQKYECNDLQKMLDNLVIKKYLLKKKLRNVIIKGGHKSNKKILKNQKFYKNNPQQLEWLKKRISYIRRRSFGYLGYFFRRYIKKPFKRKKIKRFKKLNWLYKNNIKTIFYKVSKPNFTKVIKLRNDLIYSNIYKSNDIKIKKNFKLLSNI